MNARGRTSAAGGDVLVLFLTRYCNIACDHCIVDSGRERRGVMGRDLATAAIAGATAAGLRAVVFSGGESLVYEDELLHLAGVARRAGMTTRVFTNAFWARSLDDARMALARLAALGVDELVVSMDAHHLPFMPAERVRNVRAAAATARPLPFIYYQMVLDPGELDGPPPPAGEVPRAALAVLRAYGMEESRCVPFADVARRCQHAADRGIDPGIVLESMARDHVVVQWLPAFRGGRARGLATLRARRDLGPAEGGGCAAAGRQLTVTPEGLVFPCCSSWTNYAPQAVGAFDAGARPDDFVARLEAARRDPLVGAVRALGPGAVIQELHAQGHAIEGRWSDICDMCASLLGGFPPQALRDAAERAAERWITQWVLDGVASAGAGLPASPTPTGSSCTP